MSWKITKVDNNNHNYIITNKIGDSFEINIPEEHRFSIDNKYNFIKKHYKKSESSSPITTISQPTTTASMFSNKTNYILSFLSGGLIMALIFILERYY